jgi:hypothetical protein
MHRMHAGWVLYGMELGSVTLKINNQQRSAVPGSHPRRLQDSGFRRPEGHSKTRVIPDGQKMSYARGYVSSADAGDHGDLPPGARGPPAQRGSVAVVPLYNEDRRGPPVAVGLSPPVAQGTRRMRPLMCRVNRCNQSSTSRLRAHASRSGIHVQEGEREREREGGSV